MSTIADGTVLITGPTSGLGRDTTMAIATRPAPERPDLLLVGRLGPAMTEVSDHARRAGATVHVIGCDLASLRGVRAAGQQAKELAEAGVLRPLRALVANAGLAVADTHKASADGYELTFAVNYLAHAQLIGDLLTSFVTPARIVLLGSNTYYQNFFRRLMRVPPAHWRDPIELAQRLDADTAATFESSGIAYSNSKLAILYYAHELQRRAPTGVDVIVFEPGFMPGTGLGRDHGPAMERIGRVLQALPGISSPMRSGPALASIALDERWGHLRDGVFVVKSRPRPVQPFATDRARETRLWEATAELLSTAANRGDSDDVRRAGSAE
jgi:NAD(P)-dependent dehydrogenase (short-subunit alcohol dehydrogenase family)